MEKKFGWENSTELPRRDKSETAKLMLMLAREEVIAVGEDLRGAARKAMQDKATASIAPSTST